MSKEKDKLTIALEAFQLQYPGVKSSDLQSFIIGWSAAETAYDIPLVKKGSTLLTNKNY